MFKNVASVTLAICVITGGILLPKNAQPNSGSAIITNMHNKVQAKTSKRPVWQMASVQESLNNGDSLRTGSGSRAEIQYSDGTITRIGSNSIVRISRSDSSSEQRTGLRLLIGKLWLKVTKGKGLLKIETPTAVASVLGTELLVSNNDKNVSHVTTLDGLVEVSSNSGDKTLLHPGEWVEIEPGKPIEKPTQFDWDALRKNERFMLDPTFIPPANDFSENESWK